MSNICFYSIAGLNYKHQYSSCCPIQSDRLSKFTDTIIPSEIFNSKEFKKNRLDLLNGYWPKGCDLCKEIEKSNNGHSMRQDFPFDKNRFKNETMNPSCYEYFDKNTGNVNQKGLRHVELKFSNACNMSCLHCSHVYSSGWSKRLNNYEPDDEVIQYDLKQLLKTVHIDDEQDVKLGLSLDETKNICNDLNINFPNIQRIDITGGEVLTQKQFFLALKLLSKHSNIKNLKISFYSNFNVETNYVELSNLLKKFGHSTITISIDAGKNIYPYFRDGNWKTLVENIKKFKEVNNFTQLDCVVTFSAYQLLDIKNIYNSLFDLDFNTIKTSIVQTPSYINPSILMTDFKNDLRKDFDSVIKTIHIEHQKRVKDIKNSKNLNSYNPTKCSSIFLKDAENFVFTDLKSTLWYLKNIEKYIFNHSTTYRDYNRFLIYIKKTDEIWNQNFNDFFTQFKITNGELIRQYE